MVDCYKNYIDHPKYGVLWYTIVLRNWNKMYTTEEDNMRSGPLCVLQLTDYAVDAHSRSPDMAVGQLLKTLDVYVGKDLELPVHSPKKSLRQRVWRWIIDAAHLDTPS